MSENSTHKPDHSLDYKRRNGWDLIKTFVNQNCSCLGDLGQAKGVRQGGRGVSYEKTKSNSDSNFFFAPNFLKV